MTTQIDTSQNQRSKPATGSQRSIPLAYLITFHTYGTWLPGDEDGSIDRHQNEYGTPVLPGNTQYRQQAQALMDQPEYVMDAPRRAIVLRTIIEVCDKRGWSLLAAHVRTNHVHVVVHAAQEPDRVMGAFKSYASRNLNNANYENRERKRWTCGGSKRYLWRNGDVEAAIRYVLYEQGEPMAVFENIDRTILY